MSWTQKLAAIAPIVFGGLGSRILAKLKSVEYTSIEKYVTAEDDPKSQKRSEKVVTCRIEFK